MPPIEKPGSSHPYSFEGSMDSIKSAFARLKRLVRHRFALSSDDERSCAAYLFQLASCFTGGCMRLRVSRFAHAWRASRFNPSTKPAKPIAA